MVRVLEIREVAPSDDTAFAGWHAALAAGALDGRVAATVSSLRELTDSLSVPSPSKRRLAVGAWDGDDCVGAMLFELPLRSDLDTVLVEIDVPPAHRARGVGAALWEWAERRARREGRGIFQSEVHVPDEHTTESWPGARFATARGFVSANVEDHLVVELPFDADRLEHLDVPGDRGGFRVAAWAGRCPDQYVESWAHLRSAMSQDVPTGELARDAVTHSVESVRTSEERLALNWLTLSSLALTGADEPVGYSTLLLPRTQPEHVYQDDTLVLQAHRGHGLGTRLKVANLRRLADLPAADVSGRRWLHTYTSRDNTPMQKVNARLGFRAVEQMHEFEKRTRATGGGHEAG